MSDIQNELKKREILRLSNEESNKLTKECLQTALLILLENKPLEKITVTELVKRSGVSRSAFYRNYTTKEDVLNELSDKILNDFNVFVQTESYSDPYEWFYGYFNSIKENANQLRLITQAGLPKNFILEKLLLLEKTFYKSGSTEEEYATIAFSGALFGITLHWLKNGQRESVEEMAKLCERMLAVQKTDRTDA